MSGAENGAERAENRVERIAAERGAGGRGAGTERGAGLAEKRWSGSAARSGRSRSGNVAGSGGYRNRLKRGAAFSPLTFRSHAL